MLPEASGRCASSSSGWVGGSTVPTPSPGAEPDEDTMLRWVLLAYPDRVVRRRGPSDATGVMVGGRGVRLTPESVVRDAEFFVALDPRDQRRGGTREAQVGIASALRVEWLEDALPGGHPPRTFGTVR